MHLQMIFGDLGSDFFQSLHELPHAVHAVAVGDQHRVLGSITTTFSTPNRLTSALSEAA